MIIRNFGVYLLYISVTILVVIQSMAKERFNTAEEILFSKDVAVVATHLSNEFDTAESTKDSAAMVIEFAKTQEIESISLQYDLNPQKNFIQKFGPTYTYYSSQGEIDINVNVNTLIAIGGHLFACLKHTLIDLIVDKMELSSAENINLILVAPAVYERFIHFPKKYWDVLKVKGKLTLSYGLSKMSDDVERLNYLADWLPMIHYSNDFSRQTILHYRGFKKTISEHWTGQNEGKLHIWVVDPKAEERIEDQLKTILRRIK